MRRVLILGLLLVAGLLSAACGVPSGPQGDTPTTEATQPSPPPEPAFDDKPRVIEKADAPPPDWSMVGATAKVGDVEVELLWGGVSQYSRRENKQTVTSCSTVLQFRLTNRSTGKIHHFDGWRAVSELSDEHGNKFKPVALGKAPFVGHPIPADQNKGLRTLEWANIVAADLPMHPGKSYGTYAFFEVVPKTTKELRFSAPTDVLEGDGEVRLRIPVSYRNSRCDN
jgi:hypothetical protein